MDFKVVARVAGSASQGSTATESDLVKGEFSIRFITPEKVASCKDQHFFFTDLTYDEEDRVVDDLTMPTGGAESAAYKIKGKKLEISHPECDISIAAQVKNPWTGEWIDLLNDDNFEVDLDKDSPYVKVKGDQEWYLNAFRYYSDASEEDESFSMRIRFLA
jgi:hypothetical protein